MAHAPPASPAMLLNAVTTNKAPVPASGSDNVIPTTVPMRKQATSAMKLITWGMADLSAEFGAHAVESPAAGALSLVT